MTQFETVHDAVPGANDLMTAQVTKNE